MSLSLSVPLRHATRDQTIVPSAVLKMEINNKTLLQVARVNDRTSQTRRDEIVFTDRISPKKSEITISISFVLTNTLCTATTLHYAFPVIAARTWNSLPEFVTSSTSLAAFKQHLKTVRYCSSEAISEHIASTVSALHTFRRITRPFDILNLLGVLAVV